MSDENDVTDVPEDQEVSREIVLEGFTLDEAERIQGIYVCSQCEGWLTIVPAFFQNNDEEGGEGEERFFLVCPDDGNIEQIGRISRTTVAIRNEQGLFQFPHVCKALPDLWGSLIPVREKRTVEQNMKELGF